MRRRCGGVGWNTSVEPVRLTNAVRMSDCLIMTATLPFADMFPCGTDHSEIRACTEPGSRRVGLRLPKGGPLGIRTRSQQAPTPSGPKLERSGGGVLPQ